MKTTPPLLQKMFERQVGDLVVRRREIFEPKSGCRVAYEFPNDDAAEKAAAKMNEVADWFGIIKSRAGGINPNCQDELGRIALEFGGKLATGNKNSGIAEARCAEAASAAEQ